MSDNCSIFVEQFLFYMDLQKLIKSGYKATIVECGHGAEIANAILCENGASDFLVAAHQPYSKDIQNALYSSTTSKFTRSVSKEFVKAVLLTESTNMHWLYFNSENYLTVATSFQLDNGTGLTHGYLGIRIRNFQTGENKMSIYHLSFYRDGVGRVEVSPNGNVMCFKSKTEWIRIIKDELLNIIYNVVMGEEVISDHIDGVWCDTGDNVFLSGITSNLEETLKINHKVIDNSYDENFITIAPNGELIRFEDVVRQNTGENKGIILQKGSYNPFHRMHQKIGGEAKNVYPGFPHVLMLSLATCDKGNNDVTVLMQRINNLNTLGYTVMVSRSGMFLDNVKKIRLHYDDLKIVFPVGEDTIERFFRDWESYYNNLGHDEWEIPDHEQKYNEYYHYFKGTDWFISRRDSETKHFGELVPKYTEYLDNFGFSGLSMDDISSTKIRSGEIVNELQ